MTTKSTKGGARAARTTPRSIAISLPDGSSVSGALHAPARAKRSGAAVALAHGAGNDMTSPFMLAMAEGLAARGHAVLRFNFPYKERGKKAPDPPAKLEAASRAAAEALRGMGGERLFLGGKSMGGRIASQIVAKGFPCDGLVFFGYPLHPAGRPESLRDEHLAEVASPMLFLTGTRDPLCDVALLRPVLRKVGKRATLHLVEGGDHSFEVLKSLNRSQESVYDELLDAADAWIRAKR